MAKLHRSRQVVGTEFLRRKLAAKRHGMGEANSLGPSETMSCLKAGSKRDPDATSQSPLTS
jgi:hypothetical protein